MQNDIAENLENADAAETAGHGAGCAVIVVEREKVSLLSPDAARLLGVVAPEQIGEHFQVLPEPLRNLLAKTLSAGKPFTGEITLSNSDGEAVTARISCAPLEKKPGKISGAVALLHHQGSQTKVSQIDRLASIGTLSASMAHEIKNALVAIRTFTDLLLSRNPEDELAGIVGKEMARIDSIVSQMLTFSGPAKPTLVPLHMHELLSHSLGLVQHQLDRKNIAIERSFSAAMDVVKADDYQLKQAFLNLFLNALESLPQNGRLMIATELLDAEPDLPDVLRERNPARLRVAIRDNGAGIPPENLGRVFEPFFTTKPKGTGLGLPITRRIIQVHQGTISVESQPDQGATFHLIFPIFQKSALDV